MRISHRDARASSTRTPIAIKIDEGQSVRASFRNDSDFNLSWGLTLGFASWVWMSSLTRSMGAVAVLAMEPETPPCER
jgi:hypothetical protein|tara:strand:+ start:217 stop:450 length:234 start_codon:yes stop_codon:yes gene_type:complete